MVGSGEQGVVVPAVLSALLAADGPEAVRQDTVPRLDSIKGEVDGLRLEIEHLHRKVDALTELTTSLADQLAGVMGKLARVVRPFRRHPSDRD